MKTFLVITFCLFTCLGNAQTEGSKLYNPDANAEKDIAAAIKKAKAETRNPEILAKIKAAKAYFGIQHHQLETLLGI